MQRLLSHTTIALSAFLLCCFSQASAQDSNEDLKAREEWLRYSNWEHRSRSRRHLDTGNAGARKDSSPPDNLDGSNKLLLPEHPGSQTVQGGQFTIPGWAFQPAQEVQRPPEFIINSSSFGSTPGYDYHQALPYYRSGYGAPWGYSRGWGTPWSYQSGWAPGWGNNWGSHWGNGWKHGWGRQSGWGAGIPYGLAGAGLYSPGLYNGFRRSSLGPTVIQGGPSPSSGNYYQPASRNAGSSGNYYASGSPWQVPLNGAGNPADYWGPQGNPFK